VLENQRPQRPKPPKLKSPKTFSKARYGRRRPLSSLFTFLPYTRNERRQENKDSSGQTRTHRLLRNETRETMSERGMTLEQSSAYLEAKTHCKASSSDDSILYEPKVDICKECNVVEPSSTTDDMQTIISDLECQRYGLYILSVRNQTLLNSLAMNVDAFIK
jgi:hypothetical protein